SGGRRALSQRRDRHGGLSLRTDRRLHLDQCDVFFELMKFLALIAVLIASFLTGVRPGVQGAELRIGIGAVVITPPTGTPLSGYYEPRGSPHVLADIYTKTLTIAHRPLTIQILV